MFTFELLTAAIQPCQYLQGAIVTESFHTHINTPAGTHLQSAAPRTLLPESDSADNRLYIEAACTDLPASSIFQHFCLRSEKTWRALSLLFTQLDPWKGLLNMKFDMSNEVTGRNEGKNPSGRERGRWR